MFRVSLWEALCRKAAQTEAKRNGDRAFTSVGKAIRAISPSEGKAHGGDIYQTAVSTSLYVFQILQIVHTVEECPDTLAFATEPVLASLANILAFYVSLPHPHRHPTSHGLLIDLKW